MCAVASPWCRYPSNFGLDSEVSGASLGEQRLTQVVRQAVAPYVNSSSSNSAAWPSPAKYASAGPPPRSPPILRGDHLPSPAKPTAGSGRKGKKSNLGGSSA
jgi:hypothetical protein